MRLWWFVCEEPGCDEKIAVDANRIVLAYVPVVTQLANRGWQWVTDGVGRCPKHKGTSE